MGHMHFDISIPLVSNTNLILAKTNSLYTVMYVLNEKRKKKKMKYPIRRYIVSIIHR